MGSESGDDWLDRSPVLWLSSEPGAPVASGWVDFELCYFLESGKAPVIS